jgi:hypothetical protein
VLGDGLGEGLALGLSFGLLGAAAGAVLIPLPKGHVPGLVGPAPLHAARQGFRYMMPVAVSHTGFCGDTAL